MLQHFFHDRARNEGKRARTRALLMDSAISIVAERGVLNTSIQELTHVAGLSNGTFYNHFDDREQLIRESATAIAIALAEKIAARVTPMESGLGRIVLSTEMFIKSAVENPDWGKMLAVASNNVFEMRLDIANNMLADINLAISQGAPLQVPDRFRLIQIGSLIALAIEAQLNGHGGDAVVRETCDAQLRLLGATPQQAEEALATYLD